MSKFLSIFSYFFFQLFVLKFLTSGEIIHDNEHQKLKEKENGPQIDIQHKTTLDESVGSNSPGDKTPSYEILLRIKRKEQSAAVQSIRSIEDIKKREQLIETLLRTIKDVMAKSQRVILKESFDQSQKTMPKNDPLREEVAKVVENTAFLAELALYFPDFVGNFFSKNKDFRLMYEWAYSLSTQLEVYDNSTEKMVLLGAQQLNIVERGDDFVNPYTEDAKKEEIEREILRKLEEEQNAKKKSEKLPNSKKSKKGPSLSRSDL